MEPQKNTTESVVQFPTQKSDANRQAWPTSPPPSRMQKGRPEGRPLDFDQVSRKLRSFRDRLGCLSLRSALASIWRMRSRVTENC